MIALIGGLYVVGVMFFLANCPFIRPQFAVPTLLLGSTLQAQSLGDLLLKLAE